MEEQRLDFKDYPAKEQQRDVQKHEAELLKKYKRELYVCNVNGELGAILPKRKHNVIFLPDSGVSFEDFITDVKNSLEKCNIVPHFHCVRNFGIENEITKAKNLDLILNKNLDKSR